MGIDQTPAGEIVTVAVSGAVGTVTLGAPALTWKAKEQVLAGLRRLSGDDSVRAVVLTGTGRVFCAGQDLAEHASVLSEAMELASRLAAGPTLAYAEAKMVGIILTGHTVAIAGGLVTGR